MKNLPPFYVGQKVEAIIAGYLIPTNRTYRVLEIEKCSCCNAWYISVTINKSDGPFNCDRGTRMKIQYRGGNAKYFRAIEEKPMFMTFEKIKEKEKEEVLILN